MSAAPAARRAKHQSTDASMAAEAGPWQRTSKGGHVSWGVMARSTGLLGYQALTEPSIRENRDPVDGHSMQ